MKRSVCTATFDANVPRLFGRSLRSHGATIWNSDSALQEWTSSWVFYIEFRSFIFPLSKVCMSFFYTYILHVFNQLSCAIIQHQNVAFCRPGQQVEKAERASVLRIRLETWNPNYLKCCIHISLIDISFLSNLCLIDFMGLVGRKVLTLGRKYVIQP